MNVYIVKSTKNNAIYACFNNLKASQDYLEYLGEYSDVKIECYTLHESFVKFNDTVKET